MSERREAILSVLALGLLGLTVVGWFTGEAYAVAGYDFATSLNPLDELRRALYLWDERLYTGTPNLLAVGTIPYFFLQYAFEALTGSLYRGQMVFFYVLFTMPGLAMYLFIRVITSDGHGARNDTALMAAVFYMLNTFVVVKWNRGELITLFSYGLLPLYLALVELMLRRINALRLAVFTSAMLFYPVTLGHSADFVIVTAVVAAYTAWRVARGEGRLRMRLTNVSVMAGAAALTGAWWAVPVATGVLGGGAGLSAGFTNDSMGLVRYYSSWASLLSVMKMWFFSMYPTAVEFNTQFYRPGTLLFPLLGFSALLVAKRNRFVLFFAFVALAGLWLSKGTHAPLSGVYEWMYLNVPYFFVFRAPSRYFPMVYVLALSVLVGYAVGGAGGWLGKTFPRRTLPRLLPAALTLALVLFHAWPLFSRDHLFRSTPEDRLLPSVFMDLPDHYRELESWLSEKEREERYFRVHSFTDQAYLNYEWGYSSTDITPKVLTTPQTVKFSQELVFGSRGFHTLMDRLNIDFWRGWSFAGAGDVLSLMSVRYLLDTGDVMRRYLPDTNYPEVLPAALDALPGVTKAASFGPATVYENPGALPHIYTTPAARAVSAGPGFQKTLALAGLLGDRPLFIDFDAAGAGPGPGVSSVVTVDRNLSDMACSSFADSPYLFTPRRGATEFAVASPGEHLVWVKRRSVEDPASVPVPGLMAAPEVFRGTEWRLLGVWDTGAGGGYITVSEETSGEFLVIPRPEWNARYDNIEKTLADAALPLTRVFTVGPGEPVTFRTFGREAGVEVVPVPVWEKARRAGFSEEYGSGSGTDGWLFSRHARKSSGPDGLRLMPVPGREDFKAARKISGTIPGGVDLEKYPRLALDMESSPPGYFDADALVWLDTDGSGWVNDLIAIPVMRGGVKSDPGDITDLLKEEFGYPGRERYRAIRLVLDVRKAGGAEPSKDAALTVRSLEFYHDVPEPATVSAGGALIDGDRVPPGPVTLSPGPHTLAVEGPDKGIVVIRPAGEDQFVPEAPYADYERIDPTSYRVRPSMAGPLGRPFWLVFNEAFHDGWEAEAKTNGAVVTNHAVANGYANAWYVEPRPGASRLVLTVEYTPQGSMNTGVLISLFSSTFVLVYMPAYGALLRVL